MNTNPCARTTRVQPALFIGLVALSALAACQETEQATYAIQILAPVGQNPFAEATRVALSLDGWKTVMRDVRPGSSFELTLPGLRPARNQVGSFTISAFAADERLVALGRSPPIEIQVARAALAIFVQAPGTLGERGVTMPNSLRELSLVSAPAVGGLTSFNVPVVFGGEIVGDTASSTTTRSASNLIFVYNPVLHWFVSVQQTSTARFQTALLATSKGPVVAFGGRADSTAGPIFPAIVEQFELLRTNPILVDAADITMERAPEKLPVSDARLARARAALAETEAVFAFGGEVADEHGPKLLDSIVRIDVKPRVANRADAFSGRTEILSTSLLTPRSGATATRITAPDLPPKDASLGGPSPGAPAVLIFGGAAPHATGPAAERFTAAPFPAVQALSPPGGNRREHSAVALIMPGTPVTHNEPVLIVGGMNDDGQPVDSLLVYWPKDGTFTELSTRLAVARWGATVFLAGRDLVVVGGVNAAGRPLDQAEIFDVNISPGNVILTPLPSQSCLPRYNARAAAMPDDTVIILGGTRFRLATDLYPTAEPRSSPSVEIYRPRTF